MNPLRLLPDFCVVAVAFGALLVLACSGDSTGGQTFDPQRAGELAHAALLSPADLPGSGWTATENDDFTAPVLAPGAICDGLRSLMAESNKGVAGRAQRRLERGRGLQALIVEVEVDAHERSDGLKQLLDDGRQLVSNGGVNRCFAESFKLQRADLSASVTASQPSTNAARGGLAFAEDVDVSASAGGRMVIHREHYIWISGNFTVSIDVIGMKDRFSPEVAKVAVQKTSDAVDKASKTK